MKMYGRV